MNFNHYVTGNSLNLERREINIRKLISFLQSNSNITELNVRRCNIGTEGAKELAKLTNLTSLNLSWNNIGDEGVKELTKLTNLTSLNLADNKIDAEGAKKLTKLTNLTSLDLSWNEIGTKGAKELTKLTNLTSLNLAHNKIDAEGAKKLTKLTNLTSLDLADNKIDAEVVKELAKLTNLTSLNLAHNKIGTKGAKELTKLTNLTSLNLKNNNIGDEGVKELTKLTNLTSLNLAHNKIDAEVVKELAKLTNLTSLDLEYNKIDAEGAKELTKLTNLTSLNLAGNKIDDEGKKILAESKKNVQGLRGFYRHLKEAWLKNSHASKLDKKVVKDFFFYLAQDNYPKETLELFLDDFDKYPFNINSRNEQGHTLAHFYTHNPETQKFLFERGMVPEEENQRRDEHIVQNNQSVHASLIVKRTNFLAKKLVESTKYNEKQLKQAADSYLKSIEQLKQYQNDPVRLGLLNLTDSEKSSVMEKTLNVHQVPNDKGFIKTVIDKTKQILEQEYLRKNFRGEYDNGYPTNRMQYDYARDDAKITIPESIGYIKLLIDNFSVPLKEKKELLVTLMEQNPELVGKKLPTIKKELGNSDILNKRRFEKTELYVLLNGIDDSKKIDKLFKEISDLDIEKVWREQKEFVLLKQIYIAATTYGKGSSACIQGTWSQIINSINEISTEILAQYDHYLEEEQKLEAQKNAITKENIKPFLEDLANQLIQYVKLHPELKETLEDFVVGIVDIDNPEEITFEQQKILTEINKYFSENIKGSLPNYNRNIPNRDEYDLIIKGLSEVSVMQNFTQSNQELSNLHIEEIAIQIGK